MMYLFCSLNTIVQFLPSFVFSDLVLIADPVVLLISINDEEYIAINISKYKNIAIC